MSTRRRFLLSAATFTAALPLLAQNKEGKQGQGKTQEEPSTLPPSIAAFKDRSHEATPIALPERETRADKARALMSNRGIAALCITGGTSLAYFTGIHTGQSERLFAWILPATGNPYIVCPVFEEARMTEQLG